MSAGKLNVDEWVQEETGSGSSGAREIEILLRRMVGEHESKVPVDPAATASTLGYRVVVEDIPAARVEARISSKIIRVPQNADSSTRRFAIAHEIGHLIFTRKDANGIRQAYQDEIRCSESRRERSRARDRLERLCDIAARILLVPRKCIPELAPSEICLDVLFQLGARFDVSPSVVFARLGDVGSLSGSPRLVLLEFRRNRFTGEDPKWRVASRWPRYDPRIEAIFWENESVERYGIRFPTPHELADNSYLAPLSFSVGQKNWKMYPEISEENRHWILGRIELASSERNLTLFE